MGAPLQAVCGIGLSATSRSGLGSWARLSRCVGNRRFIYYEPRSSVEGKRKPVKYKFVDRTTVHANAGRGGKGCIAFTSPAPGIKRPSGGSGACGGDVYVMASEAAQSLAFDVHHYNGGHGSNGGPDGRTGRRGKDRVLHVPLGTLVYRVTDRDSFFWSDAQDDLGEEGDLDGDDGAEDDEHGDEEQSGSERVGQDDEELLADLNVNGAKILVAKGGAGGLGNAGMAGRSKRYNPVSPMKSMGMPGESFKLKLELKTIADVGLVGYPNAGKSTFLGSISRAKPEVASYPFTTLKPMVGHVEFSDARRLVVADLPGLIDGAHLDKGLGHEFLRHIERTKGLLYVIDAAGSEGRDPCEDLLSLHKELYLYDPLLAQRPAMVIANKSDLEESEENLKRLRKCTPLHVVPVSAVLGDNMEEAVAMMRTMVDAATAMSNDPTLDAIAARGGYYDSAILGRKSQAAQ